MKKVLTIIGLSVLFFTVVNSQNNIGIFVGGGISDMRTLQETADLTNSINADMNFLPSYYGGFNFENIITERQLYFQFGLQAISRGYSSNNDSISYFIHNAYIPLELKYKYFFSRRGEGNVFISAGPYVAASYKGTKKNIALEAAAEADTTGTIVFSPEIKFGKLATDDMEPFDYGINATAGFGYSHIQIAYNFSLGLRNMIPSQLVSDYETAGMFVPKLKHMNHSVTVGFYFSNK